MGDGLVVVDHFFRLPASSGDAWSFAPGDARGLFNAVTLSTPGRGSCSALRGSFSAGGSLALARATKYVALSNATYL